jgi:hypothetical protein
MSQLSTGLSDDELSTAQSQELTTKLIARFGSLKAAIAALTSGSADAVKYLTNGQLQSRWQRSHMFIKRLLENDPDFARLAKPMRLGPADKNSWLMFRLDQIEAYERLCAGRSSVPAKVKVSAKKPQQKPLRRRAGSGARP